MIYRFYITALLLALAVAIAVAVAPRAKPQPHNCPATNSSLPAGKSSAIRASARFS